MDQPSVEAQLAAGAPSPEHYLDGAIRLRQAATWNTFDSLRVSHLPSRIIPIVDADVIRLFMAPAEETRYVNPFPGKESDQTTRREWDDPLVLVATATAEFIFLTGKIKILDRDVGNWNEPVRIAPSHYHDVETMMHQVTKKIEHGLASIADLEDKVIDRLDRFLRPSSGDGEAAIRLVRELPASLRDLYLGPVYEAQRYIRLRRSLALQRLEGLTEATRDIIEPAEKLVEHWRDSLFESLLRTPGPPKGAGRDRFVGRARERAKRDAVALASVTALNEAGLQAGPRNGWRAVLISGDEHLHRAYARWAWAREGRSLRPERYVLRRPLQYTPVLNVVSMSDDASAAEIFRKLTEALDLTIDMLLDRSEGIRNRYWLEYHWELHGRSWLKALDQYAIQEHLANCNGLWLKAINSINARNYPYLTRDYQKLFERLRAAFDEPNAQDALRNYTISIVEEIGGEHFRLVLEETTAELARNTNPMRMPFLVREEFSVFLGGRSLAQFLYDDPSSLAKAHYEPAQLEPIAKAILDFPGVRATLLTAILAAATGSFLRASRLMMRAEQLAERSAPVDPALLDEMNYFHALITRLNIESVQDYERARNFLKKLKDLQIPFNRGRAHSERAALELQWFAVEALGENNEISQAQKTQLVQARQVLLQARDALSWPVGPAADRCDRELAQQIVVNAIALNVYLKLADGQPDLELVQWAREQFRSLFGEATPGADYITKLWWLGAAWLTNQSPESSGALLDHCRRTLDEISANEAPVADRNDLKRIVYYLERRAAPH